MKTAGEKLQKWPLGLNSRNMKINGVGQGEHLFPLLFSMIVVVVVSQASHSKG